MKRFYQHGDILLKEHDLIPAEAKQLHHLVLLKSVDRDNAHQFPHGSDAILFQDGETIYAAVGDAGADLVHDEHKTIRIPCGRYVMDRVREYDYDADEMRRVVD